MTNYKFFRLFLIMSVFLVSSTMVQAIVPVTKHKRVLVNDKYFLEKYQDSLMLYKMNFVLNLKYLFYSNLIKNYFIIFYI